MTSTTMLHIRVDEKTKTEATQTLASLGLTMSDEVRIFLRRVVIEQGLPLNLKVPNAAMQAAMLEARAMTTLPFATAQDLSDAIEEDAEATKS